MDRYDGYLKAVSIQERVIMQCFEFQIDVEVDDKSPLFKTLDKKQQVLLTHGDSIDKVADNYKVVATSKSGIVAGIANEKSHIYGLQFHPEVDLTQNGKQIFKNFLYDICGLSGSFTLDDRQTKCIQYINEKVDMFIR